MAEIFPFEAYRYNLDRVSLRDVITQPYDKITPAMQQRYLETSPYNLIAVEKGQPTPADSPTDNVYTRAEQALAAWIREGILLRDSAPGIYVYSQEYTVPGTAERSTRRGFIALGRVEDYAAGVVFRHEQTLSGPKVDRLELLRHTRTHTGQFFMLYADPDCRIDALLDTAARSVAPAEARDEYGVLHRLWPLFDPAVISGVVRAMAPQKLVIADGHHRYETALAYRNECRAKSGSSDPSAPYERAMMTFFNTQSEGLLILPTHRVVANLTSFDADTLCRNVAATFEAQAYSFSSGSARAAAYAQFRSTLAAHAHDGRAIGMYVRGVFMLLTLRHGANLAAELPDLSPAQRSLDVVLLHRLLLEKGLGITAAAVSAERNITYEREMDSALAAVDKGAAQVCFLLNPVSVEQVTGMALAGEVLPQKSTDFYPKLLSGLTLYRLD
jgi:uncharacterized protein (DUF1015 family)